MSSNRKKRLSIIDFFGKSSDSTPTLKTTKKPETHRRSTSASGTNKTNKEIKAKNRMTFTIPDESITSNMDFMNIPNPQPRNRPNRASVQMNNSSSPIPRSVSSPIKTSTNNNTKMKISSPVSPVVKNSLPMFDGNTTPIQRGTPSPAQSPIPKTGEIYQNNTPSKDRLVSNTSLSSSVYPGENRSASNSTLPDFARKSSSIYPPSTVAFDKFNNRGGISTSGTIKRSDLLRKRKPPPMPLSVTTEHPNKEVMVEELVSPSEKRIVSATESFASSDTGYSPLNLMPVTKDISGFPLSSEKQLDPAKNVMFAQSSVDYELPSFKSREYDTDYKSAAGNGDNIHKHTKTLSSIEEITNALNVFQVEHEKSFSLEHEGDVTMVSKPGSGRSTVSGDITKEDDTCEPYNPEEVQESPDGIFLKVKDLPQLQQGESLEEYINKLKTLSGSSIAPIEQDLIKPEFPVDRVNQPINTPASLTSSTNSSTSEVFFDVRESSKEAMPLEPSHFEDDGNFNHSPASGEGNNSILTHTFDIATDNGTVNSHEGYNSGDGESVERFPPMEEKVYTPKTMSSTISSHDNGLRENVPVDEDFSQGVDLNESYVSDDLQSDVSKSIILNDEADLIGPLDGSFESFVKSIEPHGRSVSPDYGTENDGKNNDIGTPSTAGEWDENGIVQMDDGGWERYSNATNFFNDADLLEDSEIVTTADTDAKDSKLAPRSDFYNEEDVVTPTDDNGHVNLSTPTGVLTPSKERERVFDLDDELDNNVTYSLDRKNSENSISKSLEDLYPADSDGEYLDEDENSYADTNSSELVNQNQPETIHSDAGVDRKNLALHSDSSSDLRFQDPPPEYSETVSKGNYGDDDDNDDNEAGSSVLEFSPRLVSRDFPKKYEYPAEFAPVPPHASHLADSSIESSHNGTPTGLGLGIGDRGYLKVMNDEEDANDVPYRETEDDERMDIAQSDYTASVDENEAQVAPIPDIDSIAGENEESVVPTYDRRESPTIRPIEHSMVVNAAAPLVGTSSYAMRSRRPPPSFPSAGRRSRALSEATANPELFVHGIPNRGKVTTVDDSSNAETATTQQSSALGEDRKTAQVSPAEDSPDSRKGEKCSYIENLRLRGKKTTISAKPPMQTLPIAIRQNGTITHKKIPSQQLSRVRMRSANKHVAARPRTRMLASEIDEGELPDATKIHTGQKTKVPIHPDAAVIAASEQFNKLAKQRSGGGDLGRFNSIMSVKPHYGDGMRLFITNPDSDDD